MGDNYKILNRLGKGGQGAVYLVEHRKEGKKYVLKKVECNDESDANKAFQEAMALKDLQHSYICGYKEFFVMWDKEDCAMYVCIVMENYIHGDLEKILRQKRENGQLLDEMLIKKWLGQIIEALIFVHKNGIIHRDLKPSNIFLQDDMNICIGDFGVATIMGDVRTKTRTVVGSMNWMAPEVLERPYDERSDVWSLGCIALELITCGMFDSIAMAGKLNEIKHKQQALDDILKEASQSYSSELISVVHTMLTRNYQNRPTAEQLADEQFIKECLILSDVVLAERRKCQNSGNPVGSLPKNRGTTAVFEYLRANVYNEDSAKESLDELETLTREDTLDVDSSEKRLIITAMKENLQNAKIQIAACRTLNHLVITARSTDYVYSKDAVKTILMAIQSHKTSADLQLAALTLLAALSADEGASEITGVNGGLQAILDAIEIFPENVELTTTCCHALWSLTVNEDNARIVTEQKGVLGVVKALRIHSQHSQVVEAVAAVLLSLTIEDENLEIMSQLDCVGLLLKATQDHIKEGKVIKNCFMALAAMVEPSEELAYSLLSHSKDGVETRGLSIVVMAYEHHRDNAEVVETICSLLVELAEYDEICAEAIFLKIGDVILADAYKRFKDNSHVIEPCSAALKKITSKIRTSNLK